MRVTHNGCDDAAPVPKGRARSAPLREIVLPRHIARYVIATAAWTIAAVLLITGIIWDVTDARQAALFGSAISATLSIDLIIRRERVRVQDLIELCRHREAEQEVRVLHSVN